MIRTACWVTFRLFFLATGKKILSLSSPIQSFHLFPSVCHCWRPVAVKCWQFLQELWLALYPSASGPAQFCVFCGTGKRPTQVNFVGSWSFSPNRFHPVQRHCFIHPALLVVSNDDTRWESSFVMIFLLKMTNGGSFPPPPSCAVQTSIS